MSYLLFIVHIQTNDHQVNKDHGEKLQTVQFHQDKEAFKILVNQTDIPYNIKKIWPSA